MSYIDPLDVPDLNEERLHKFMTEELGIRFSPGFLHQLIIERDIVPTRIGRNLYFTRRDALEWLVLQRKKSRIEARDKRRARAKRELEEANAQLAELG